MKIFEVFRAISPGRITLAQFRSVPAQWIVNQEYEFLQSLNIESDFQLVLAPNL
jgi:hypothetical protein